MLLDSLPAGAFATIVVAGGAGFLAYALVLSKLFPAAWGDVRMLAERVMPPIARLPRRRVPTPLPSAAS
jgi:hypothetical protein